MAEEVRLENLPQKPTPTLPIEEIARYPLPGMGIPANFTFSPDDRLAAALWSEEGGLTRQLYAFDLETGAARLLVRPLDGGTTDENVSLEEALRRERQRQREFGVTAYAWAGKTGRLLIPLHGDLYVQDEPGAGLRRILDCAGTPAIDPQPSPDGEWVAYVQDAELYVLPMTGGEPRQVTHGGRETGKTNGLAEYIAQEEMHRSHGFWWSPDSSLLAFEEVDETHIPVYRIVHQGKDFQVAENKILPVQEDHHYPFAGGANAHVRLGVVSRGGGEPIWMDLGEEKDIYLARVDWLPDGTLAVQVENREQTRLDLLRCDPHTGRREILLSERNPVWINLHNLFRPLKLETSIEPGDGTRRPRENRTDSGGEGQFKGFLWASERDGFRHLYLYDAHGKLVRQLTQGEWMVDDLVGVSEADRQVYFTATLDSPLECHLYRVSLSGGEIQRITHEPGVHSVVLDHACRRFVDTHHALDQAPTVRLRFLEDGTGMVTFFDRIDPRIEQLGLRPPRLVEITNRQGDLLYGAVYQPVGAGSGPFPAIVAVYGGPHSQQVTRGWLMTANMRAQYLRSLGFLVFILDNRGSARRGLAFEAPIKGRLGHWEVEDQVDGVRWLIDSGLADLQRVGIYGWSYGGYLAAMCLARAPEVFQAAVAGAPVTHWDGYDTHYTERYMGTPRSNPQGYTESSVMFHVPQMRGHLMLVHGLIDENVHFRHTARLINALVKARKSYELLLFPDERHMPRQPADRIYLEERIRDFFVRALGAPAS